MRAEMDFVELSSHGASRTQHTPAPDRPGRSTRSSLDPRERRVTRENVPLADDLDGYPAISRAGRRRDSPRLLPRRPRTGAPSPTPTTGTPPRPRPQDRHEQAHRRRDEDPHKHRPGGRPRRHCADLARKPERTRPRPRRQGRRTRDPKHTTDLGPARTRPTRTEPKHAQPDSHIEPFSSDHWRCPRAITAAVRDGRGRAHPGRDVHFALENDGWSCTFEYEVHVWASGGARPGRRLTRGGPLGGPRRRGLSKSATKAPIAPERARRIVDIPRFSLRSIPPRGAFVADLDTTPPRTAPGAPPAPPRARPSLLPRRLGSTDPDPRTAVPGKKGSMRAQLDEIHLSSHDVSSARAM